MGAKRKSQKRQSDSNYSNVVEFTNFKKQNQVTILPRNKNQETYTVDEDLGFLPGTLEEKMAPWTRPIFDVLKEYFNAAEISGMIAEGIIEISPLAYMRGRTFKNSFILADEMQNATENQMKMLLTRLGEGSMMAVTGDLAQADRIKDNGLIRFVDKLKVNNSTRLDIVQFAQGDIERHEAVKEVLKIYGDT